MRAILEAHSMVRCGEETHIIPRLLGFREMWYETDVQTQMLLSGGLSTKVMQSAFASFILEVRYFFGHPQSMLNQPLSKFGKIRSTKTMS
jgi:protein-tyrosine sulfotransferase